MSQNPNQTKLSNPPTDETKMAAPRMTKCRLFQDVNLNGQIIKAGQDVEMTDEQVAEFCDRKFVGPYSHTGETEVDKPARHTIVRAKRLSQVKAAEELKKIAE